MIRVKGTHTVLAAAVGATMLGQAGYAANRVWEGDVSSDFNLADNWTDALPGTGDKAQFTTSTTLNPQIGSSITMQGLIFAPDTVTGTVPGASGGGYTLSAAPDARLLLSAAGGNSNDRAIYQNTTGSNEISAPITFTQTGSGGNPQTIEVRAGALTLSGSLTGSGRRIAISLVGGASVHLSAANHFTGLIYSSSATTAALYVDHANGLNGSGVITLGNANWRVPIVNNTGATLNVTGYSELRLHNGGSGQIDFQGGDWNIETGLVLDRGGVIEVSASTVTLDSIGQNDDTARSLAKFGTGTLVVEGDATHAGTTTVRDGVLRLNGAMGSGNLVLGGTNALPENVGGVLGLGAGDFTRALGTEAGEVSLGETGGGLRGTGGFAAYGGDRVVNLGGDGGALIWNSSSTENGTNKFVKNVLLLGAADATHRIDFQNPIDFNAALRTVEVRDGVAAVDGKLSGVLTGTGNAGLNKTGAGTLELSADNTYAGNTVVAEGTLLITGSVAGNVNVNGGTLGGTGTIHGVTTINEDGALAIGASPGTLTFGGDLVLNDGSVSTFEIEGFDTGEFDLALAAVDGEQGVSFGGTLNLTFASGFNTTGSIAIFDFDTYAGDFGLVNVTGLASGYSASFDAENGFVTVVPEPSALMALGLGGLTMLHRRRRTGW